VPISEKTSRLESTISPLMMFRKTIDGYSRDQVEYKYVAGETLCHLTAQDVVHMLASDQFFGSSTENLTSQYPRQYSVPASHISQLPHLPRLRNSKHIQFFPPETVNINFHNNTHSITKKKPNSVETQSQVST